MYVNCLWFRFLHLVANATTAQVSLTVDAVKDDKVYIVNSDTISHAGRRAFEVLGWMDGILREPASQLFIRTQSPE
jgi:hypothetical protein